MTKEGLISEKLRGMIGKELPVTQSTEINRKLVADFIGAIEDPNSEFTKEMAYSELVTPNILMLRGISYKGPATAALASELPPGGLDAGGEFEVFKPFNIGDVITARTKLSEVSDRESKSLGKMLLVVLETNFANQKGEVVATFKHNSLRFKR